jgi:mRNA interferase HigB
VRVISRKAIREFVAKHPDAAAPLDNWHRITRGAQWRNFAEVRQDFRSADVVGRRTIFNIHGNDYRLVARVNYKWQRVYILKIMTHAAYTKEGV